MREAETEFFKELQELMVKHEVLDVRASTPMSFEFDLREIKIHSINQTNYVEVKK